MNDNWISILSVVIPTLVSLVIYFLQSNKKRLSYEILSKYSIISNEQEKLDDIVITYKNEIVTNMAMVEIAFINNGNRAISKLDYEKDIEIKFSYNDVLSAEIDASSPKSLKPEIIVNPKLVLIKPVLLNGNDLFVIRILIQENYLTKIEVDGRITEVKNIKEYSGYINGNKIKWFAVGFLIMNLLFLFSYALPIVPFWENNNSNMFIVHSIGTILSFIIFAYGESLEFKISRRVKKLRKNANPFFRLK